MLKQGDLIVLFLLVGAILAIAFRPFRSAVKSRISWPESDQSFSGEVPDLLAAHGYQVIAGKQRVPVSVHIGEKTYDSRLYIDYIARRQQDIYLVIIAKSRKPLRLSGAAVRDRFLAHFLAFQPEGILYVEPDKGSIKPVSFELEGVELPRRRPYAAYLLSAGVGLLIALLFR
ncbi:MAG: hypothetical protein ACOYEF_01235 [Planifilum sp.]|jgi:hypothetical protein